MAIGIVRGIRLLVGALASAAASFAFASPVTVHYDLVSASGKVYASGGLDSNPSAWLSNPVVTSDQHMAGYLVKFWVAPLAPSESVTWSFAWALTAGAQITAKRAAAIYSADVNTVMTLGTAHTAGTDISGTIIATDSTRHALPSVVSLAKGQTYTPWDYTNPNSWQTDSTFWYGGTTTEVWAYFGGASDITTSGGTKASFDSYGNIWAAADVARPVLPDSAFLRDDSGGGAAPEPGSLALLCGAGLMGLMRRRRDRLKPSAVPAV